MREITTNLNAKLMYCTDAFSTENIINCIIIICLTSWSECFPSLVLNFMHVLHQLQLVIKVTY